MMERLFTERDVLAIVDEALMAMVDSFDAKSMEDALRVLIERAEADKAPMTFPPDEPMFLLRASEEGSESVLARVYDCAEYVRDQAHYTDLLHLQFAFTAWRDAQEHHE